MNNSNLLAVWALFLGSIALAETSVYLDEADPDLLIVQFDEAGSHDLFSNLDATAVGPKKEGKHLVVERNKAKEALSVIHCDNLNSCRFTVSLKSRCIEKGEGGYFYEPGECDGAAFYSMESALQVVPYTEPGKNGSQKRWATADKVFCVAVGTIIATGELLPKIYEINIVD